MSLQSMGMRAGAGTLSAGTIDPTGKYEGTKKPHLVRMRLKVGADGLEPALARYERVVLTFELRTLSLVDYGVRADSERGDAVW